MPGLFKNKVMPIDYKKYPSNWKTEIVPSILKRAKNRCEKCNARNKSAVFRGILYGVEVYQDIDGRIYDTDNGAFIIRDYYAPIDPSSGNINQVAITIVITIAHLDHNTANNEPSNLKALCQLHHLRYDAEHHKNTRKANRIKKLGLVDLFDKK